MHPRKPSNHQWTFTNNDIIGTMDYRTDFSAFRLLLLDIVAMLYENHGQMFATERSCARVAQLVWVTPTYVTNGVRTLYREWATLQARSADRATTPRIIFREPALMAATIMAWATVRSTLYQESEELLKRIEEDASQGPPLVPAGYEREEARAPSRAEEERLQEVETPSFSPISSYGGDEQPESPPPAYELVDTPTAPPPSYEDISPATSMVDLTSPPEAMEFERHESASTDLEGQQPADTPRGLGGSASQTDMGHGLTTADGVPHRDYTMPYVRHHLRGGLPLPMRPLSLLNHNGEIIVPSGRVLPCAPLRGQIRPVSPHSSQLGRIRITRTEEDGHTAELLPPAVQRTEN